MNREKVELTGAPETMLATLYLRAVDSRSPNPILGDADADRMVRRIDYDFSRMRPQDAPSVAIRAKKIDDWVREFLAENPAATVVHLGCGLDSRGNRVSPPDTVQWYDVDLPEVIDVRRRVLPERENQHMIAAPVTQPELFDQIPTDKPVLVVAEGLTMYLSEVDGQRLLRRIVEHFSRGVLVLDVFSRLGVKVSNRFNPYVVRAGARLHWGVDDPRQLEAAVPGLTLDTEWFFTQAPELSRYPWLVRQLFRGSGLIPAVRRLGYVVRYRFGDRG